MPETVPGLRILAHPQVLGRSAPGRALGVCYPSTQMSVTDLPKRTRRSEPAPGPGIIGPMLPLLAHWLPDPPAIVATFTSEAVGDERLEESPEYSKDLQRYATILKESLGGLTEEAKAGQIDLEKILWELRQQEAQRLREARYWEKRAKAWQRKAAEARAFTKRIPGPVLPEGKDWIDRADAGWANAREIWQAAQGVYQAFKQCRVEIAGLRKTHLKEYAPKFVSFLASLPDSEKSVRAARWAWQTIKSKLPAPECALADGGVIFVWDHGPHHLEMEFLEDGGYDWFYRNRETNASEGQEDLAAGSLPQRFLEVVEDLRTWS